MGSAPGDNTKIMGVVALESVYEPVKSNAGLSINKDPKEFLMKCLIYNINFVGLRTFNISILENVSKFSNVSGNFYAYGSVASITFCHSSAFSCREIGTYLNELLISDNPNTLSHVLSSK